MCSCPFLLLSTSTLALHRWPYPNDVHNALRSGGVNIYSLRAARPDIASQAWRSPQASEVEARLFFLTQALGKTVDDLVDHPQYLWSRFERHVLPRALYAHTLGALPSLTLRELLGTPDLRDRPSPVAAWPAVCGVTANRTDYEACFWAVQRLAEAGGGDESLLSRSVEAGLDTIRAEISWSPTLAHSSHRPLRQRTATNVAMRAPMVEELAMKVCPLCERPIPPELESRHHLVPKLKGGKMEPDNIVVLHRPCHDKVHAVFTEAQLARSYASVEALLTAPEIATFVHWIRKRPIGFADGTTSLRRRRQRGKLRMMARDGLDAESDSVGAGIYGGRVQRDANGEIVIGQQYEQVRCGVVRPRCGTPAVWYACGVVRLRCGTPAVWYARGVVPAVWYARGYARRERRVVAVARRLPCVTWRVVAVARRLPCVTCAV